MAKQDDDHDGESIDARVGAEIRRRRKELGMSAFRLGQLTGVSVQMISLHERGTTRIGAARLYRFARALEVSVDYFFSDLKRSRGSQQTVGGNERADLRESITDLVAAIGRLAAGVEDPVVRAALRSLLKDRQEIEAPTSSRRKDHGAV